MSLKIENYIQLFSDFTELGHYLDISSKIILTPYFPLSSDRRFLSILGGPLGIFPWSEIQVSISWLRWKTKTTSFLLAIYFRFLIFCPNTGHLSCHLLRMTDNGSIISSLVTGFIAELLPRTLKCFSKQQDE